MQKNSRETLKLKEIKVQWEGNIFLGISGSELAVLLLVTGNLKKKTMTVKKMCCMGTK